MVPADLEAALAADPDAQAAWDRLSYTHRREHVEAIEEAKRDGDAPAPRREAPRSARGAAR